jgi:hypothetical protein
MSNNKLAQLNIEDKEVYNSNINYHLNTIKVTLDYLHATRLKSKTGQYTFGPTEKLDSMIEDLIKVVKLIKGFKR